VEAAAQPSEEEAKWGELATLTHREWWKGILKKYPVLAAPVGVPPLVRTEAVIKLLDDTPVASPPHRLALNEAEFAKAEVRRLKELGIVVPVRSPYAAPVVVVKKRDGGMRLCVDYRKLNMKIIKDKYPLPRVDDLLRLAAQAKVFSRIDLRMGFHQVPLRNKDQRLLAFTVIRAAHIHFVTLWIGHEPCRVLPSGE